MQVRTSTPRIHQGGGALDFGSAYSAACNPARNSTNSDDVLAALEDPITDPLSKDTDFDGLPDKFELTPYQNAFGMPSQKTSPEHPDTVQTLNNLAAVYTNERRYPEALDL